MLKGYLEGYTHVLKNKVNCPLYLLCFAVDNDDLRETDAHVKSLSLEPLLGPLPDLNLDGIGWVIVGGE